MLCYIEVAMSSTGKQSATSRRLQMQELVVVQSELKDQERDCRKAQQLLRQLERQLAKGHMSRKDAAAASQQLQVTHWLAQAHQHLNHCGPELAISAASMPSTCASERVPQNC